MRSSDLRVVVVLVTLCLEFGQDPHRVFIGPIGQLHHVFPIRSYGIGSHRIDDDRPIDTGGLLHARMGGVPIGAALLYFEAISERRTRRDPRKTDTRRSAEHTSELQSLMRT